ncbi:MAG: CarD family transcriptional regulator, partial [Tissierellaceae bacterium]
MQDFIADPLNNLDTYKKLKSDIEKGINPIATYGITDESIGHFLHALKVHTNRQILLISYNEMRSRKIYEDLKGLGNVDSVLFPKKDILFYDIDAFSNESSNERLGVISRLAEGEGLLVISSIEAILDKLISKEVFKAQSKSISLGEEIDLDSIRVCLVENGYESVSMVEAVGQFSIRGGILDFFPPHSPNPFRIEFFDVEVDSIRTFDVLNQKSREILDRVFISPVKEILILDEFRDAVASSLEADMNRALSRSKGNIIEKNNIENKFGRYGEYLREGLFLSNRDMVVPYIPPHYISSILDFLREDALVFIDEPRRIEEGVKGLEEDFKIKFADLYEVGELLSSHEEIRFDYGHILRGLKAKTCVTSSALLSSNRDFEPRSVLNFSVKGMQSYHNKMEILKDDLEHFKYRGYKIVILSGTEERGRRLKDSLLSMGIEANLMTNRAVDIKSSQLYITPGSIFGGFEYPNLKFLLISDKEIFGAGKKRSSKQKKKDPARVISLSDLKVDDYIVHENHGIGRYEGIEQLNIQGVKKDYLTIKYKGADKLYVPIDQMNLIQKYIGSDSIKPKVNKLSSADWVRTKERAKKAVEDMALELLELYAKRENGKGFAYSEDGQWQREFEDLFPYEETEGQLRSIEDIKMDMEGQKPMDRLLCGDVG